MSEKQTLIIEEMNPSVIQAEIPEGPCLLRNPNSMASDEEDNKTNDTPLPITKNNGVANELKSEEKKSRIPVTRFKQTVKKIGDSEHQASSQPPQPKLRRKIPTVNSDNTSNNDKLNNRNTVEDFDKLFGDLTKDGRTSVNSDILKELSPADPNQVDNYFEQIIKTYNKEQNAVPEEPVKGLDTPTTNVLNNFDYVLNDYVKKDNYLQEEASVAQTAEVRDVASVKIAILETNEELIPENINIATNEIREVLIPENINIATNEIREVLIPENLNTATNEIKEVLIPENLNTATNETKEVLIPENLNIATNNTEHLEEQVQIAETVKIATLVYNDYDTNKLERVQVVDTFVPVPMEQPLIANVEEENKIEPVSIHPDNLIQPIEVINVANDVNTAESILIEHVDIQPVAVHPDNIIQPVEVINVANNVNTAEEINLEPTLIEQIDIQPVAVIPDNILQPNEVMNVEVNKQPALIEESIAIHPDNIVEPVGVVNREENEVSSEIGEIETEIEVQKSVSEIIKMFEYNKMELQSRIPRRFNRNIKVYPMFDQEEMDIKQKTPVSEDVLRIRSVFKTMKSIEHDNLMREKEKISGKPEIIAVIKKKDNENIRKFRSMSSIDHSDLPRSRSRAELDLGTTVKGRVEFMINRINSIENSKFEKEIRKPPKKLAVMNRISIFEQRQERKYKMEETVQKTLVADEVPVRSEEELQKQIEELLNAKQNFGTVELMPKIKLSDGNEMPVLAIGTALLDAALTKYIIMAAIDLGYRAIDSAFIYGNEKQIGEAIRAKIEDGTVKREDLFIINKLWSTFHKSDLVEEACRSSLETMGLEYFDLYLIHNPMSFKEGKDVIPKIANVLQFSTSDYLDAWRGMELLVKKQLVKSIGVSNFNSNQIARVHEKAAKKPVINQVESHPYLNQLRLDEFCSIRDVKLSCFATLGSKGTPTEYKSSDVAVIDDALVKVLAAAVGRTPAQMLIRYQLDHERNVVVKSSTPAHLWENLQVLNFKLTTEEIDSLNALNKNRRYFNFKGMGDTHKNYPFTIPF